MNLPVANQRMNKAYSFVSITSYSENQVHNSLPNSITGQELAGSKTPEKSPIGVGVSTGERTTSDESADTKNTSSSSEEGKSEGIGKTALPLTQLVRRGLRRER